MVKAIEQIRQDLDVLTERTAKIKHALTTVYTGYLEVLGQGIKRQLVLSCFQLCTQIYPQGFLKLSYSQRQKLQQELRQLGNQTSEQLQVILDDDFDDRQASLDGEESDDELDEEPVEMELIEVLETLDQSINSDQSESEAADQVKELTLSAHHSNPPENPGDRQLELSQLAEQIAESLSELIRAPAETIPLDDHNPEHLNLWHKTIEKRIRRVLNQASRQTNRLLQAVEILPKNLPTKVLDMAIQADQDSLPSNTTPNLINVLIEAESSGKKKKEVTKVTAIHLRISEIEFADPKVSAQRNRIREQLAQIAQLKKRYQKSQKDLAIAEAEAAWRSSWYESQ